MSQKKRRRKISRQRTNTPPLAPPKKTSTVSVMKELTESFIDEGCAMSEDVRKAFMRMSHDQAGKTMLHLSAVAIHKQLRQAQIAGIADFATKYISDMDYLKKALADPDWALKFLKYLHTLDVDDTKFLYDMAVGVRKKEDQGWDSKDSMNLLIGVAGANPNNLPKELQNPHQLRAFRDKAQTILDMLAGIDVPKPPQVEDRVVRSEITKEDLEESIDEQEED